MDNSFIEALRQLNQWLQNSIPVKAFVIGTLVLILLIPKSWVDNILYEREHRAQTTITEVASKWSGKQTLGAPILVIPYRFNEIIKVKNSTESIRTTTRNLYILPDDLNIQSNLQPQILHRGIYDVAVYQSNVMIAGSFKLPKFSTYNINESDIIWNEVHIIASLSDLRGIQTNPIMKLDSQLINLAPISNHKLNTIGKCIGGAVHWKSNYLNTIIPFNLQLQLRGSEQLSFLPYGKQTHVTIKGDWANPKFIGSFLPDNRTLGDSAFEATWEILAYNREFEQEWDNHIPTIGNSNFGVELFFPVDQYQKTSRTSKYGVLTILLTFLCLFLTELITKIRVHPFRYLLIGASLVIYYTLLLSLAEQLGFYPAYLLSSLAVITMNSLYGLTFLPSKKHVLMLCLLLVFIYSFVLIVTLQQDYALLIGSIGLMLILSVIMFISRNISIEPK
ncbi:MAG: cell envelope integrity protein CreD [Bacteroidia bacterium]|jgi:inner membrane protein|nr:cell envelope integrity protein CreD [Bacteroidia bacterium]